MSNSELAADHEDHGMKEQQAVDKRRQPETRIGF